MRTLKLGLLTVILLTLCVGSLFAGGFALSGIGSKAIGMGGAFRGLADDPTAMYWNPAGLGFMDRSYLTLAGAGILPTAEFEYSGWHEGYYTEKVAAEEKLWLFPNIFFTKGGGCKLKFGLGAYVPYGLGVEWDAYDLPTGEMYNFNVMTDDGVVSTPLQWADEFPDKEMKSSIGIVDIHPTVAYQFNENWSLGAGLSVNYGMITIKKLIPTSTYAATIMDLEGTGLGFGGNLGIMYKVNEYAQFGISGKLPSSMKMDGDVEITTWRSNKLAYYNNLEDPDNETPWENITPTRTVAEHDAKATLNLPGDIGLGVALMPSQKWTISADVSYTFWNSMDKVVIDLANIPDAYDPVMNTLWKDTFRFSLGTQYKVNKVALRGGFFYDETPVPYNTLSLILPDFADKYSGNVGLGFYLGKWVLDLNYEHIFVDERKIKIQTEDNLTGTYNSAVDAFNMALSYTF